MSVAKQRVLVVDDDPDCRLVIATLVAQAGYHVDSVADGNMAMMMINTQQPDIVLLDFDLPGKNGWEVCRSIKGNDNSKAVPVVMLTAFASPENLAESLSAGADEFVPKPFRADSLLELIKELLARPAA